MAILAAIEEKERSRQVVEIGYDLAETYGDTLIALHVVPTDEFESYKQSVEDLTEFGDISISQHEESAERFARKFVRETIDDVDEDILDPRGRVGNVSDEILAEAESVDPRYLVISGRRRSPAGKAIFGNTTQKILLNADCPVVTKLGES